MDDSWDEYDAYDLSEFSAADFVHIDNTATTTTTSAPATPRDRTTAAPEEEAAAAAAADVVVVVAAGEAWGRVVVETGGSGGLPQVAVALESAADESVVVKVAEGGSGSGDLGDGGAVEDAPRRSPFEEFRRRGTLSVSDLVGPAWYVPCLACREWLIQLYGYATRCGVQFDYGLRQGRSLALTRRPESFVSAEGKEMKVDKKVAKVNDKTMGRGRVSLSFLLMISWVASLTDSPHLPGSLVCSQKIGA